MLSLYVERRTVVHALHPVAKVLGLFFLFVAAFVADQPLVLAPLLGSAFIVAGVSGAFVVLWRLRLLFVVIVVMTMSTWPFFYDAPLHFSSAGLRYGISMGFKLATFFAYGIIFLATTKVEELAAALRALHVPYYFGFTLTLAVRLVPVFFSAALTVRDAQRCRGLDFASGRLTTRMRQYARLIVPVFLGALRRADHMAMALEVRGFNSDRVRTVFPRPPFGSRDAVALGTAVVVAGVYLWLWRAGLTRIAA